MNEISELLKAIASLLWPILGFVVLLLFRSEIAKAVRRIKRGKFFGQEFELSEELAELQKTATKASEEVAALPRTEKNQATKGICKDISITEEEDSIKTIIKEALHSPKTALLLLASEIEKEARQTLASIGRLKGSQKLPLPQIISKLDRHYGLPKHVESSLRMFWDTRNAIIHGGETEVGNILSAIDSGATILRTLKSLPRENNRVHHEGVPVYSDPHCIHELLNVKGVILQTESPSGAQVSYRIFPSTKSHFKKGERVAWEWSFKNIWPETWYRDPETDEIKPAWTSSAEFIGRHLEDV
jgi:hypothetical protein